MDVIEYHDQRFVRSRCFEESANRPLNLCRRCRGCAHEPTDYRHGLSVNGKPARSLLGHKRRDRLHHGPIRDAVAVWKTPAPNHCRIHPSEEFRREP
jgi:hypothetical protein